MQRPGRARGRSLIVLFRIDQVGRRIRPCSVEFVQPYFEKKHEYFCPFRANSSLPYGSTDTRWHARNLLPWRRWHLRSVSGVQNFWCLSTLVVTLEMKTLVGKMCNSCWNGSFSPAYDYTAKCYNIAKYSAGRITVQINGFWSGGWTPRGTTSAATNVCVECKTNVEQQAEVITRTTSIPF